MPPSEDFPDHAAPMFDPADASGLIGRVISGRYRIEQLLGEGGMGAVYLATHTLMRKKLAVKVLHPEMTRRAEVVARFEREAMAAAHIEHPNVASATDFGKLEDGSFFLVLEFVEGRSLRESLFGGKIGSGRSLHIAKQIAHALARAHSLGIVHRDLKPENVMLVARDGDPDFVKVLDFGIAKVPIDQLTGGQAETLTRAGMIFGTPEYMAPEQALGEEVDHRADLYALGVMLYEMLAGSRPFEADSAVSLLGMQVTQKPPGFAGKIPPTVEAIVMRLLEKQPAARFQSAREVIEAVDAALVEEGFVTVLPRQSYLAAPAPKRASRGEFAWFFGLQAKLPGRLAEISPLAFVLFSLAVALTGIFTLVSLASAVARSGDGDSSPGLLAFLPSGPSEAELADAMDAGAEALVVLVEKYPADVDSLRALSRAQAEEGELGVALETIEKLLEKEPTLATDAELGDIVQQAARAPDTMTPAFALLEGPMGSRGADLLYELATSRGVPSATKKQANQALARTELRDQASPPLQVALALRSAGSCSAKKALMPRAEEHGDARSLSLLRPLTSTTGCGFVKRGDCFPCLRDGSLTRAIKAIEEREKSP